MGNNYFQEIFVYGSSYLKLLLHLSKLHREDLHNWSSNCENFLPQYDILSLTCLLKMQPIKLDYDGTLTLWKFHVKMLSH